MIDGFCCQARVSSSHLSHDECSNATDSLTATVAGLEDEAGILSFISEDSPISGSVVSRFSLTRGTVEFIDLVDGEC